MHGAARRGSPQQHRRFCSRLVPGPNLPLTALPKQSQLCPFREAIHRHNKISSRGGFQMNKNDLISAVADASGLSKSGCIARSRKCFRHHYQSPFRRG